MARLPGEAPVWSGAAPHLNDVHFIVGPTAPEAMFGQHQPVGLSQHVQPGSEPRQFSAGNPPGFGAAALGSSAAPACSPTAAGYYTLWVFSI